MASVPATKRLVAAAVYDRDRVPVQLLGVAAAAVMLALLGRELQPDDSGHLIGSVRAVARFIGESVRRAFTYSYLSSWQLPNLGGGNGQDPWTRLMTLLHALARHKNTILPRLGLS